MPPAQAAAVDRYHYAGSLPLAVLLCLILQQLGRIGPLRRVPPGLALAAGLAVLAVGYAHSGMAIDRRYKIREYFARTMREIDDAVEAHPPGSTVYLENLTSPRALLGPMMPDRLFPGRAGVFVVTHPSDMVDGRRVRFIERDPEVLTWYGGRPETRLAHLLVGSQDVDRTPMTAARIPHWHPLVLLSVALSAWVYFPITRVYFYADDWVHLLTIANDGPLGFILRPFGGHSLLASNLVFVTWYKLFGLRSEAYYWLVLLTHLLNVSLLFAALRALTRSVTLACFGAALWGASPAGRSARSGGTRSTARRWSRRSCSSSSGQLTVSPPPAHRRPPAPPDGGTRCLLLGVVSFGTGIGVALAFPAVFFLILPPRLAPSRAAFCLPGPPPGHARRLLRCPARLSAGSRRFRWWSSCRSSSGASRGLPLLFPVVGHMLVFSMASVVLGFFRPAISLAGVLGRGGRPVLCHPPARPLAWRLADPARGAGDGCCSRWSTYLVIALGRATLYSDMRVAPWQMASFERYHYVATIPIVALLCLALQQIGRLMLAPSPATRCLALAAGIAFIVTGRLHSRFAIDEHLEGRYYVADTLRGLEAAVAAQPPGTGVPGQPGMRHPGHPRTRCAERLVPGPGRIVPGHSPVVGHAERDGACASSSRITSCWPAMAEGPGTRLIELMAAPEDVPPRS